MPLKARLRRIRNAGAALLGAGLFVGAVPAVAGAACLSSPETTAFSQFGDSSHYMLAPGGSFESGAPGWKLSHATVVAPNESFNLTPGSHSLAIEANGSAVSPYFCVNNSYPTFRFVAHQLSGPSTASLKVGVRWVNLLGVTVNSPAGTVRSGDAWAPSSIMKLNESLPLVGGVVGILTLEVNLVFAATGGKFAIDDVYVDPYRR